MNRRTNTILLSSALLVASAMSVVGATYALFSAEKTFPAHITTGNLDFTLARTKVDAKVMDVHGLLVDHTDPTLIDLTTTGEKAFEALNAVPGCEYTAYYQIDNTGTTAFDTVVSIEQVVVENIDGTTADDYILDYVRITIACGTNSTSFLLSEVATKNSLDLGVVLVDGGNTEFTIKTEILKEAGNDAQNLDLTYGIKLSCVQVLEN